METPSSTRRVTGSQSIFSTDNPDSCSFFKASSCSKSKTEDSSFSQRKNVKTQEDRSALLDITNDSPIVGLAMQTPPSGFMCKRKNSRVIKNTPGSGEALLRGQVKTLLEKVEEGTELTHSIKSLPFIHLVTSPMRLLAPTPANTPQLPHFSDDQVQIKISSPVVADHLRASQAELSMSRSLLLDFTDKSTLWKEEEEVEMMSAEKTPAEFAGKRSRSEYKDVEIIEAKN